MDKVKEYRHKIVQILSEFARPPSLNPEIERQFIGDTERDRYAVVFFGWQNERRVFGSVLYLEIKNGKIWIQHNNTELEIAKELVSQGVPKEDIVLGLHSPFMRQYTDYATG